MYPDMNWLCFVALILVVNYFNHINKNVVSSPSGENIIIFLTDDQDMSTMPYLEVVNRIFGKSPIRFENTFTTTPVCCPSRSIFVSGRLLHNNGAINNSVDGDCGSNKWQSQNEQRTFAWRLNQLGSYDTFYAGKYLNTYLYDETGGPRVPAGWTDFHGTGASSQYFYNMSDNGVKTEHLDKYPDDYMPLVVQQHALNFLRKKVDDQNSKPFLMVLAFTACHVPDDAEPKYQDKFANVTVPRLPHFNSGTVGKEWIVSIQESMDANQETFADMLYRKRLQTLATVEDTITNIIAQLNKMGVMERTHLFYASDNGFHTGQYRMVMDKRLPYDTDIRVPIMWLPSKHSIKSSRIRDFVNETAVKVVIHEPVALVDLAPTFVDIAGVPFDKDDFDGQSMVRFLRNDQTSSWRNALLVEYRGEGDYSFNLATASSACAFKNVVCTAVNNQFFGNPPLWHGSEFCFCQDARNNSYNCLRITTPTSSQLYCEFDVVDKQPCEFYDLALDPYQLVNKCQTLDVNARQALSDELSKLKRCSGANCSVNAQYHSLQHTISISL